VTWHAVAAFLQVCTVLGACVAGGLVLGAMIFWVVDTINDWGGK
jgi:hypothetical protein